MVTPVGRVKSWREFYASIYANPLASGNGGIRARARAEVILANLPRKGRVLDIGCGDGDMARFVQARIPGYVGLDFVEIGLRNFGRGALVCADALRLPFRSGSFAAALLADTLRNFSACDIVPLLREIRRVARYAVVTGVPLSEFRDRFYSRVVPDEQETWITRGAFAAAARAAEWRSVSWMREVERHLFAARLA